MSATKGVEGAGIGLRACHYAYILQHKPDIAWFEVLSDNYMVDGGSALKYLDAIVEHYPITLHGVGMSIGSTDPLNIDYLSKLKRLVDRTDPAFISDHLCWISVNKQYLHELMPLPYTQEAVDHVVQRVQQVQDFLGRAIMLENLSSYFTYKHSEVSEADFLASIAKRAGCDILLDVNNLYVNAKNLNFDALTYIKTLPKAAVKQIHLAGYTDKGDHLFDMHSEKIHAPVWALYKKAVQHFGAVPTLIEWDDDIPAFSVLAAEAQKAQGILNETQYVAAAIPAGF